jgi:hypothetical protein
MDIKLTTERPQPFIECRCARTNKAGEGLFNVLEILLTLHLSLFPLVSNLLSNLVLVGDHLSQFGLKIPWHIQLLSSDVSGRAGEPTPHSA